MTTMGLLRAISAALTAIALIAGAAGPTNAGSVIPSVAPATAPVAVPPAAPAPTLVVVGNHLVDTRSNHVFTVHAVNWPSFEYACWQGWGYSGSFSASEAQAVASWGVNAVRLPLNQDCWLGLQGSPASGTMAGYRSAVANWVDLLNAAGLAVILDLHSSAPLGYPAHGQRAMADAQSVTFWASVAGAFQDNPSVMFDAFNEPYSRWNNATNTWTFHLTWDCWRNGGCSAPVEDDYTGTLSGSTYSVAGMSSLVAAIRGAGAAQPVMLGGIDYSNDLRGWLANAPDDDQLVASWHNYPGQRCSTVTCWNSEIAPVAAVVPIVTGEFGQTDGGSSFLTTFMNWADAHGVGYAPWAWWKVSNAESLTNSRYALVDDPGFTPKAPSGTTYHDHLAGLVESSVTVNRIAGATRYATSLAVSSHFAPGVDTVYVAAGATFADSLSAAPAASFHGGPLLLSPGNEASTALLTEIARLSPDTIVLVGGTASLSQHVFDQLAPLAAHIRRDGGADRYSTSREIVRLAFPDGASTAFIATGRDFPDALSAAAVAGTLGAPVILVNGTATHADSATMQLLADLGVEDVVIAGGTGVVSVGIAASLTGMLGADHVTREGGTDRYATSVAINRAFFTSSETLYLATGRSFPDALSGAALAGIDHAPLYVVPGTCVPQSVLDDIGSLDTTTVYLLGGVGVLSAAVETLTRC
jgi:putative cell wall-binding protein